jgi:hypothetical protein
MVRSTRLPHTPRRYKPLWCGTPGYLTPHVGISRYSAVQQDILHFTQIPAVMGRYTMLPHTPPRYQQFSLTREKARYGRLPHTPTQVPAVLPHQRDGAVHQVTPHLPQAPSVMVWCGTPGYPTQVPAIFPHQGDGRIHQITKSY